MTEVVIGSNAGCANSMCMPRPMKPLLIIEPPQVEPLMVTSVGSGQNTGWPEIAPAQAFVLNGVRPIFGLDFQHHAGSQVSQVHSALDFGLHDVPVHGIAQMRARAKHPSPE